MPTSLTSLVGEINTLLSALSYSASTDFHKIATLQTKNDKTFPIVRRGQSEAYQISPNDTKSMVFYHRLISTSDEPVPQGKGMDTMLMTTYTMRLVGVGKRRSLSTSNDEDNSDLALTVKLLLNGKRLSDGSKVYPVSTITDKISIFEDEWSGNDFNNLSLEITAFAIDYNIKQRIVCAPSYGTYTPSSLTATANGFTQIDLAWTNTLSTQNIKIYRSTTSGFTPSIDNYIATVDMGGSSYLDTVNDGTTYYYKIAYQFINSYSSQATATTDLNLAWTSRTSAADNNWYGITHGNGLFVAVAQSGTGDRVMTSPNGVTWTSRTSAADNNWYGVTYGNGLFVAVAASGTGNRVMTSPDGITWTIRSSAADNQWTSVTYGNGLFVAVAQTGTGNRVMTSPDGITWTIRTSAANNSWTSVTYGNGLFVAVASSGIGNRVMTSSDGITWTSRTSPSDINWSSVTYGNGLFVAVSLTGSINRVMTSPDGINWTLRSGSASYNWTSVAYGNGSFVAVTLGGTNDQSMISSDGITWRTVNTPVDNDWVGVTYGDGVFVAISQSGTGNRVMTGI